MFKTIRKWLQSEHRYIEVSTDPRAARHWHNPADPVQAARIEAAAAKRGKRKNKTIQQAIGCSRPNRCDQHNRGGKATGDRTFNPFYVAH